MGKPRPASVLAGAVVGVGLVVAVVVAVMLVVGGVVFGVRRSRFLVLEGEEAVVVELAEGSPMRVSVRPWAVNAPATVAITAASRSSVPKRAPLKRRGGGLEVGV